MPARLVSFQPRAVLQRTACTVAEEWVHSLKRKIGVGGETPPAPTLYPCLTVTFRSVDGAKALGSCLNSPCDLG